ncbi:hypothetical protein HAX54_005739 [Datura stramonium]|uniref:Uncharacterized protein n=1 Tax=Datura stramonium TaxID=4076 RepID=A0ABS8RWL8_DATST|nr:hypothetical protein [Datura stramonium]
MEPASFKDWFEKQQCARSIVDLHPGKYIIRGEKLSFLVFAGLRGTHPYVPARVLRQLGMRQETSQIGEMARYITKHEKGVVTFKDMIIRGWGQKKVGESMVKNRFKPECSDTYKEWLKKNFSETLISDPNEPTQIADKKSEHQIQLHRL